MITLPPGLHDDYRNLTSSILAALSEAYPIVPSITVKLTDKDGDESLGAAVGGTIELNARWFAEPKVILDQAIIQARKTTPPDAPAWHGHIGGAEQEYERFLTHEFGHLLATKLPGYEDFARAGQRAALSAPEIAVSGYALVDPDEWWTETFAALRLGAPSKQVAESQAFLDNALLDQDPRLDSALVTMNRLTG